MTDAAPVQWSETELAFRRTRIAELYKAWLNQPDRDDIEKDTAERKELLAEIRPRIEAFLAGSLGADDFRAEIDSWTRKRAIGFAGPAGAMVLNQVVKDGGADESAAELRRSMALPVDLADAGAKIDAFAAYVRQLRESGSGAAISRAPFFLSWFWYAQAPDTWKPMWPSAEGVLCDIAWVPNLPDSQGIRYVTFVSLLDALGEDPLVLDEVLSYFGRNREFPGIDSTLSARCRRSEELPKKPDDDPDGGSLYAENLVNARVVLAELIRCGKVAAPYLSEVVGFELRAHVPTAFYHISSKFIRTSSWISWRPKDKTLKAPCLRLSVGTDGFSVGIHTEVNFNPKGFGQDFKALVTEEGPPPGYEYLKMSFDSGADVIAVSAGDVGGDFAVGRVLDLEELASGPQVRDTLTNAMSDLKPLIDKTLAGPPPAQLGQQHPSPDPGTTLDQLAQEFVAATKYPTEADKTHLQSRQDLADRLTPNRLATLTKQDLRQVAAGRYGSPGPQSILMTTIADADEKEWARILKTINTLLWDESQSFQDRIARVLDEDDLGARGLKEGVVMKLLAIAHPARFIPVFPYTGDKGKARMLETLGLPVPDIGTPTAEAQVLANDALRAHVESVFPGDPWGAAQFLLWLMAREDAPIGSGVEVANRDEQLADLATELYVQPDFLSELVELVKSECQVIFYGPPGTGKTLFAQKVAEFIAPDPENRLLVQFHPSTSYEDFVEGYRPETNSDGQLTYRLSQGPLRAIADSADQNRDQPHVIIIDEINRANLPKVFGELLYLLEYRDKAVRLLYEPDAEFCLPPNLFFIGTMNTADRSIAVIDAALRRRFRFQAFIPDVAGENPIAQVLRLWVDQNNEMEILPDIVDRVNNMLRTELGGDHLLLGPSYFMKKGIDETALRRIWEWQIEPLVEDLFYGDRERAAKFKFDRIWGELGSGAAETESSPPQPPPGSNDAELNQ